MSLVPQNRLATIESQIGISDATNYATPAAIGSTAADAAILTAQFNLVTAANGTKGVALPAAANQLPVYIVNTSLTAALKVYPINGGNDKINGLSEDAAFTLGAGKAGWFIAVSGTQWYVQDASGILSTSLEVDAKCDRSAQVVSLTATAPITQAAHEGRVLIVTGTAAAAYTLPEATGSGDRYKFIMGQVNTNGTTFVAADTTNTSYHGKINNLDVDSNAATAYFTITAGGTDTVTFDGTTKGGQIGDFVEFIDIATDKWAVSGEVRCPAGSNVASPFSSAV